MLKLLLALTAFAALSPNDVSILLPLPLKEELSLLWSPAKAGERGELLPRPVFNALPNIILDGNMNHLYNQFLKVVAIRVDPCFQEGDGPCQKNIRLVWQPLEEFRGGWTTQDAAIHTFYTLTDGEWRSFARELEAVTPANSSPKLQINPTLLAQGYEGGYWRALTGLILKYAGSQNLTKATAMTVNPTGVLWFFSGFDIAGGRAVPITIPRIAEKTQGFAVSARLTGNGEFRTAMDPAPPEDPEFIRLLKDSKGAKAELSEREKIEAVRSALVLENPRLSNPGTKDCASCHAAALVPSWAMNNLPTLNWEEAFAKELFNGKKPEAGHTNGKILRAFGYFNQEPVIARRVRYETQLVLDRMN
jgi:hypothetical protein